MNDGMRQRRLSELLSGFVDVDPNIDRDITGLTEDSRKVMPGNIFFARKGARVDGTAFVADALDAGASAVVLAATNRRLQIAAPNVLTVSDVAHCLGVASERYFGSPSERLDVVGVTGTNGKTSISYFAAQLLDGPNAACCVLGTTGSGRIGAMTSQSLTTPDAVSIHERLADFVSCGARYAVMEVSSHALDQQRIAGVSFRVAVFSNLTRDHLDYHGTLHAYGAAKRKLFEVDGLVHGIINADDPFGRDLASTLSKDLNVVTYSVTEGREARLIGYLEAQDADALVLRVEFDGEPMGVIHAPLVGEFNASNLLAAFGVGLCQDIAPEDLLDRAQRVESAPGRMQRVRSGMGPEPAVIVDFAHTPDALTNVLQALRSANPGRKIWCIFGCGGDRDRGKRREMARAAQTLADQIVVTSDNPRSESPTQIIDDVVSGFTSTASVSVDEDRRVAIAQTVLRADEQDIVLVAGKGHEEYQEIAGVRYPLIDQQIVLGALQERHA
ncbi:MAG: UDP-N-acetylmuramoyl-L-alanyl-D-glutamate--2,6-diaminopimelate ligase [Gammaproteobacteria bacterium]|nr:UDP-N-acetylmuramoyl-L-alanyl-D-glutamate--2,6-diaminopimelate ligase [Gammaproteobacteria bacterium]